MKKFIYTIAFALVSSLSISACASEDITPTSIDNTQTDPCQFGGPGCPKN